MPPKETASGEGCILMIRLGGGARDFIHLRKVRYAGTAGLGLDQGHACWRRSRGAVGDVKLDSMIPRCRELEGSASRAS